MKKIIAKGTNPGIYLETDQLMWFFEKGEIKPHVCLDLHDLYEIVDNLDLEVASVCVYGQKKYLTVYDWDKLSDALVTVYFDPLRELKFLEEDLRSSGDCEELLRKADLLTKYFEYLISEVKKTQERVSKRGGQKDA